MKKGIAILGSTGSIGVQALEVIEANSELFEIEVLTANTNAELLIKQSRKYLPNIVVVVNEPAFNFVKKELEDLPIKVYFGKDSVADVVEMPSIDVVLVAIVGYAGLLPTIKAIEASKLIALANKETLVVAGELIADMAKEKGVSIIPIDSEHSAIFQCLQGEAHNKVEEIILTASGGPFRGMDINQLANITKADALKHPNWNMGAKITIDSASLMNKGLEVIEAKWLFDLKPEQIKVIVHPQSIIHSLVQFEDSSIKAQMGLPDMKVPIQYALSYPNRLKSTFKRFSFTDYPQFTFEQPNIDVFRNLSIAYEVLRTGGNHPCVMNAANEIVVEAFLNEKVKFIEMPNIIEQVIEKATFIKHPTIEDYIESDKEARRIAIEIMK